MRVNKFWGTIIVLLAIIVYAMLSYLIYQIEGSSIMKIFWILLYLITILSLVAFVYLPKSKKKPLPKGSVIAIVPVYNEDVVAVRRTIEALLNQSITIDEIHVVDDGSDEPMEKFVHPRVFCYWQKNAGKRFAQAKVLCNIDQNKVDYILTVDSDSILDRYAAEHLLRTLSDKNVKACSGSVFTSNFNKNIITKVQEFNYGINFVIRCASRRLIGFMETTSGACAMYRAEIVFFHLYDYLTSGTVGDDRRLCIYSLLEGDVVYVPEAVVYTQAPEKIKQLFKQRLRWSLSAWKSIPVFLSNFGFRICFFPIFGLFQSIITPIILAVALYQIIFVTPLVLVFLAAYSILSAYTHTLMYVSIRQGWTRKEKILNWLLVTPCLFLLTFIISIPSKYFALFKLKDTSWGTRGVGSVAPKLEDNK